MLWYIIIRPRQYDIFRPGKRETASGQVDADHMLQQHPCFTNPKTTKNPPRNTRNLKRTVRESWKLMTWKTIQILNFLLVPPSLWCQWCKLASVRVFRSLKTIGGLSILGGLALNFHGTTTTTLHRAWPPGPTQRFDRRFFSKRWKSLKSPWNSSLW